MDILWVVKNFNINFSKYSSLLVSSQFTFTYSSGNCKHLEHIHKNRFLLNQNQIIDRINWLTWVWIWISFFPKNQKKEKIIFKCASSLKAIMDVMPKFIISA